MKQTTEIPVLRSKIMRDVEEMAAYYAAKSGDIDTTYINGLLTEPDKGHLDIFFRECLTDLANMCENYPHDILEGTLTILMPMNFDEATVPELSEAIRQYFAVTILRAWMSYIGTKGESFVFKDADDKKLALAVKIKALLNHRKRLNKSFFREHADGYYHACCVRVQ